jgi:DNA mismatch endonuclease (patch repair protein)
MSRICGKDTKPELVVRRLLHAMGYRFRLHRRDLPGSPDIVLPQHGVCCFVHGCFWHLHSKCKDARIPMTRTAWWRKKLEGNPTRDKRHAAALLRLGWRVLTIWECQTVKPENLPHHAVGMRHLECGTGSSNLAFCIHSSARECRLSPTTTVWAVWLSRPRIQASRLISLAVIRRFLKSRR